MKVNYGGYNYEVKFLHGVWYKLLSVWLYIKRMVRRIGRLIGILSPVLFLIPVWIMFMLFLCVIEKQNLIVYFEECKYSIFSSVVIASIIRLQSKVPEYRKSLRVQHEMYVSLMCDTHKLIKLITNNINLTNKQQIQIPAWPLYTMERYRKARQCLSDCDVSADLNAEAAMYIALIIDDINAIKSAYNSEKLYVEEDLKYHLDWAYRRMKELQAKVNVHDVDIKAIDFTLMAVHALVAQLQYPWRRDDSINKIRRKIIIQSNPNPKGRGHYFNLFEVI